MMEITSAANRGASTIDAWQVDRDVSCIGNAARHTDDDVWRFATDTQQIDKRHPEHWQ